MGLFSSFKKKAAKVLDYVSAPLSQPLTFFTKGPTAAAQKVKQTRQDIKTGKTSGFKVIGTTLATTAIAAGTVLAAAPAVATGAAGKLARKAAAKLVPKTPKGVITTAVAAPIVYGAVKANPEKAQDVLVSAPSQLSEFGEGIGGVISDPSIESVKELVKESPVLTAITGTALAGGAVLAAAPLISGALQREAIQDQTKALEKALIDQPIVATNPMSPQTPITPETKPLIATAGGSSTQKRKKRRSKGLQTPSIRQSVKVLVQNKSSAAGIKNYLNRKYVKNSWV